MVQGAAKVEVESATELPLSGAEFESAKDSKGSTATIHSYRYALLKVLGKGSGLDALRHDMAVHFPRKAHAPQSPAPAA